MTNVQEDVCACSEPKLSWGKSEPGVLGGMWGFLWEYHDFLSWFKVAAMPLQQKVKNEGVCGQCSKGVLNAVVLLLVHFANGDYSKGKGSFPHQRCCPGEKAWTGLAVEGSPPIPLEAGFLMEEP